MSSDGVGADGVLITQILAAGTLVMLGAGVFVHSDEAWQTVTAMAAGQVDTHRVGLAVMHLGHTLINIFTVSRIPMDGGIAALAFTLCFSIPVFTFRVFSTNESLCAEVITSANIAASAIW